MRYIEPEVIMRSRAEGKALPDWTAAVIVFHGQTRSKPILERLGGTPMSHCVFSGLEPYEVLTTTCCGQKVGIFCNVGGKMGGGPLTAILVEELAIIGVRWIVGLGCAGSIDPEVQRGIQFAISTALVTDGTSRSYLGNGAKAVTPDGIMLNALTSVQRSYNSPISIVTAATVDALYRETPEAVAQWKEAGAQVINFEVAPFYAAAEICGVSALHVGHVSDELSGDKWTTWFGEDRNAMAIESADIAAGVLEEILDADGMAEVAA